MEITADEIRGAVYSTDEAARILRITPNRVRQLCRARILASVKIGRDWLVWRSAVQNYRAPRRGRPRKRREA